MMNKNIKSATYVGGFGSGRKAAEGVAEALERRLGNGSTVNAFTFSDYVDDPDEVEWAMKGARVVTHSAGALSALGKNPNFAEAHILNPPLPSDIGSLVLRAGFKSARMFIPGVGVHSLSDMVAAAKYSAGAVAELAVHPKENFGQLKRIAVFNAIDSAIYVRRHNENPLQLVWTEGDEFFSPTASELEEAVLAGVDYQIVPGVHDEVVLRPDQFFEKIDL